MQAYDIVMLVVIASTTIFGAIKGFAWQVASLASIIASYFIANYFRDDVAKMINADPPWNMFLAMLLLYFGSSLVIWMAFRLVSTSIDKIRLKEFDRQLGAGFGLIKGAILCCIITMFAMTLLGPTQQQAIANSRSGHYIGQALTHAGSILPDEVKEVIGPVIANVGKQLETGRDPNETPIGLPDAASINDLWGRGQATVNGWGQDTSGGNPPATEDRRSTGGILSRWLNTQPNAPASNSPATPYSPPGPPSTYQPGYPSTAPYPGGN